MHVSVHLIVNGMDVCVFCSREEEKSMDSENQEQHPGDRHVIDSGTDSGASARVGGGVSFDESANMSIPSTTHMSPESMERNTLRLESTMTLKVRVSPKRRELLCVLFCSPPPEFSLIPTCSVFSKFFFRSVVVKDPCSQENVGLEATTYMCVYINTYMPFFMCTLTSEPIHTTKAPSFLHNSGIANENLLHALRTSCTHNKAKCSQKGRVDHVYYHTLLLILCSFSIVFLCDHFFTFVRVPSIAVMMRK